MRPKIPPVEGLALSYLRMAYGLNQTQLAAFLRIRPSKLCQYERGDLLLSREQLERYAAAMGAGPAKVEEALAAARKLRAGDPEEAAPGADLPGVPTPAQRRRVERAAVRLGGLAAETFTAEMLAHLAARTIAQHRSEARERCEELLRHPPVARRALAAGAREYQTWAAVERLALQSERAAADKADRALDLAGLAVAAAEGVEGSERWRALVRAWALCYLGNARRVAGNLQAAAEAFTEVRALWQAHAAAGTGPLDEARVLDREASWRRAQRRFPAALALHSEALLKDRHGLAGRFLLNKSATLQQMGDPAGAAEALSQAASHVDGEREPRHLCVLKFNLASVLCDLDRPAEALPLLAEVRELAIRLANAQDLKKALWLEGKIAAGERRWQHAAEALGQVRDYFRAQENAFEYALVTLELAAVRTEQRQALAVEALAAQALPVFVAQGIEREALAVIKLFVEAVKSQALTAGLARELAERLRKLRPRA